MKIEINQPNPEKTKEIKKESRLKSKLKNFVFGSIILGLSFGLGTKTAEYFTQPERQALAQELSPEELEKIAVQPPEKKPPIELFQGSPEKIWQQALDYPKEFIAQQGLSPEYLDPNLKKEFDQLVQNQMQAIFDTHHQNLEELDKLFVNVPYQVLTIIEEAKAKQVPLAIAIGIAMHESRCDSKAHDSLTGANGLFQIRQKTAESLGLKVSKKLDERFNPRKNARAAMTYLKKIYQQFGRWDLTLLAYNEGPTHIRHYLARLQKSKTQPLLKKVNPTNIQKEKISYLKLHQDYNEANKYPLNIEANIRLYLWYIYEKTAQEQNILAKK